MRDATGKVMDVSITALTDWVSVGITADASGNLGELRRFWVRYRSDCCQLPVRVNGQLRADYSMA